jgi:hypothetical protein
MTFFTDAKDAALDFGAKCMGKDIVHPEKFVAVLNALPEEDLKTMGFVTNDPDAAFEEKWGFGFPSVPKIDIPDISMPEVPDGLIDGLKDAGDFVAKHGYEAACWAVIKAIPILELVAKKAADLAIKAWLALPGLIALVKEAAIKFGDAAIPVLKEGGAVALCAGKEGWELSKKYGPPALADAKKLGALTAKKLGAIGTIAWADVQQNAPGIKDALTTVITLSVNWAVAQKDRDDGPDSGPEYDAYQKIVTDTGKDLEVAWKDFKLKWPEYSNTAGEAVDTSITIALYIKMLTIKYGPDAIDFIVEVADIIGTAAGEAKTLVIKYGPTVLQFLKKCLSKLGDGLTFVFEGIKGLIGNCMGKDVDMKLLAQTFKNMGPEAKFAIGMAKTPTENPDLSVDLVNPVGLPPFGFN